MPKYKKVEIVEAIRFNGSNFKEMCEFANADEIRIHAPSWAISVHKGQKNATILEEGQYLIKDQNDELRSCGSIDFEKNYEIMEENKITLSELIKDYNAVIACPKLEQANAYAKAMDKMGRTWLIIGASYIEDNKWGIHKEKTCYRPWANMYDSLQWYKEHGYKIYDFDDVDLTK
jgi:hypothetical protein